ncbi:HAD family hydrolase [Actinobacillus succinogenes]|uniref:Cof-like hydrolase n=1 Tax=Actinobacillus succinogenes (strain ATCC 55618 / DSM 22257 / CCUG 43843 / 130Z) TaxID=339671 RepID=A6VMZ5_ACTSZ|nr:Cof-type HAD-IIB family hydrolase [Actinobacillus succinogenes]ABR74342.1 Cof-like hydrolase [Actinobacillus succinogenes 130Z]PHI39237.1 HAD family hydrolase [Actinobacillus succinogenes]
MKKIIFLDVDGTLVNYQNEVPKSAVKAIQTARQKEHKVFICTGRSRAEVSPDLWAIGLDGMIGGNGSYVEYQNEVVMHQLIPAETAHKVVDWLTARGLAFYLESNNGLFASPDFEEKAEPVLEIYTARKGMKKASVRELMHGIIFGGELYRNDLNKVSFILNSYQDHLDSAAAFPELKAGTWGGVGETALFGDLGVKEIDKGYAISVLLDHLGASRADTFAFGDAKIDIPMLEYCAIGVAMGNGGDEIKAMANFVTDDVDNDGLYKAFEKFGLL